MASMSDNVYGEQRPDNHRSAIKKKKERSSGRREGAKEQVPFRNKNHHWSSRQKSIWEEHAARFETGKVVYICPEKGKRKGG